MKVFSVLSSLAILLWAGCDLISREGEDDQDQEKQARIIFGKSIEGVVIGDSESEVIRHLGEPSGTILPDYAGIIYIYIEDNSEMIWVTISHIEPLGVIEFRVYYPYGGKTADGVGIDTPRSEAVKLLGQPDVSETLSGALIDSYFFEHITFHVEYHDGRIFSIWMIGGTSN